MQIHRTMFVLFAILTPAVYPQTGDVIYEGARLILGDASTPVENGAFVVRDGHFSAIGPKGSIHAPAGAAHIDLIGKTVMPTLNNIHAHLGYEGYVSWSVANHTMENVLDHLEREAFYGVGATLSMGEQPTDFAIEFKQDQLAGKFPTAARFFFAAGMAPPGGGPDALLIQGTGPLHAVYEVSTPEEAVAAVRKIAARKVTELKFWVDNRDNSRGSGKKMPPEVYTPLIAEKVDDEFLAILKAKRPYWTPVMGLGDRSELCDGDDGFIEQVLPDSVVADIKAGKTWLPSPPCSAPPTAQFLQREENLRYNFPKYIAAGVHIVLGTDAGVSAKYSFGFAEHHEIGMYVRLGLSPAETIVASTSRPTEVLRIQDTGVLAEGKRADFIVLNANPIEDIHNTRQIDGVYLLGARLNRAALQAKVKQAKVGTR
jgi:imidazolonepropionase-like amidohydrolase